MANSNKKGGIRLEDMFASEKCDYCGECLAKCDWIKCNAEEGSDFIVRLVKGEHVPEVMNVCTNCMNCDSYCPQGARPYNLIIYRWYERYQREGIPPVFKRALPFHGEVNVWSKLEKWLSRRERKNLHRWKNTSGAEEMLFLGCNQHYDPYIVDSRLFAGIPVFSDRSYCCGEPAFRLGLLDEARRCAINLQEKLKGLGVKRLLVFCPACYNTLTNLIPNSFGINYEVELVPIVSWLKERLEGGSIPIKKSLNVSVSIQDSCHGSSLGKEYLQETRDVLTMIGASVKEMEHSWENMRCCGLGYAATRYSLVDVVFKGVKRLRETGQTGSELTTTYCNGCYFTMNMMRMLSPGSPPVYHFVELIQMAMGEKPVRKINSRRYAIVLAALEAVKFELLKPGKKKIEV